MTHHDHAKRHALPHVHFFVKISKFWVHIFMTFQRLLIKFTCLFAKFGVINLVARFSFNGIKKSEKRDRHRRKGP